MKNILVINALNGVFPLVLRNKYPDATITCAEVFPFYKHHLRNLGFEVVDWDQVTDMKFDIVVGNPPYQNGNEKGGKSSLWRRFVSKAWTLIKLNGHMAMIVPKLPNDADDLGHIFVENQTSHVWTDVSSHFPRIGSNFVAWIVNNKPAAELTTFVQEQEMITLSSETLPRNIRAISIIRKFTSWPDKIKVISSSQYKHTSVADGKDDTHLSSKRSKKLCYQIRRTNGDNKYMWGAVEPDDYKKSKVTFTYSGYPGFTYHTKNDPVGTIGFMSGHVLVKNRSEASSLISLYESKAYTFARNQISYGGIRGQKIYEQPLLPLNKIWTDLEIYEALSLTFEEIKLIELS
jgi:hypothetical protein